MTINEKFTIIREALSELGIGRKGDTVSVESNQDVLGKVRVNEEDIGLFDFTRGTFVE